MIKIGVTACFFYPDPGRVVFSHKTLMYLERDMACYLARHDVMPILIPDIDAKHFAPFFAELDGVILHGGNDIAPMTYGEAPLDAEKWPGDKYRDEYELRVLDFAFKSDKPVLGICRGCQLINVYFGGTLYQDLPTQKGKTVTHRDAVLYDQVHHNIRVTAGGLLENIYAASSLTVNSVHHQGIKTLGRQLKIEAVCVDDGLIESVSHKNTSDKFILGVQWHPEFSYKLKGKVVQPEPLYDRFLSEVRSKRGLK